MSPSPDKTAHLIEIFSSIQGEGPRVGERMTFVRFEGCALKCRWCDTPESFRVHSEFRVEKIPFSNIWEEGPNPVLGSEIEKWLEHFSDPMVSLTGGESLQQVDFLEEWLPKISPRHRILLETNGVLPQAFEKILPWVHTTSMDLKLPSSAKTGSFWKEHEEFLRLAVQSPECYVKIVVTEQTEEADLERALELIRAIDENIPAILQPVSETRSFHGVLSTAKLGRFFDRSHRILKQVRVIPQTHKLLGVF
jgi:7-carboxy-7-deazaguanine synthase